MSNKVLKDFDKKMLAKKELNHLIKKQKKNAPKTMITLIKDKTEKIAGIYGIYVDNDLVYIGQSKNIEKRITEHSIKMNESKYMSKEKLYCLLRQAISNNKKITAKVLINISEIPTSLTQRDLDVLELALIVEHKPAGNTNGIDRFFSLTHFEKNFNL